MGKILTKIISHLLLAAVASFLSLWFVKFVPYVNKLDPVVGSIAMLLLAAVVFSCLFFLIKTRPVVKVGQACRNLYYYSIYLINQTPLAPKRYTREERSADKYRKAIEEQIKKSNRIYFRLISGHTMFHVKDEMFILDALRSIPDTERERKDIKIQLLDRRTVSFEERAKKFVETMERERRPERISYQEYVRRCELIEQEFIRLVKRERVCFYQRKYLWRLHIFDDRIFISTYCDKPEWVEGHLSPAYSFNRESDASLFDGFLTEFNSLYNKPA